MNQCVICVSTKRQFWKVRRHPPVECIMQKQIGEQRGDNSSLWSPFIPSDDRPILLLHRRSQPALNIKQDPSAACVTPNRLHQKPVVDIVEKPLDIKLQHPVVPPAT